MRMLAQDAGHERVALLDCEAGHVERVTGRLLVRRLLELAPVHELHVLDRRLRGAPIILVREPSPERG